MTPEIVLPDSLEGWRLSKARIWGEDRVTLRRYGVTVVMVRLRHGWSLTRFQGGKVIAACTTTDLPPHVTAALEAA